MAGDPPGGLDPYKKALAASERDEEARTAWRAAGAQFDPQQFVFVDESGSNVPLTRRSGWAPQNERATGAVPRNHGKNTTLVAALTPDGLRMPWLIEGTMRRWRDGYDDLRLVHHGAVGADVAARTHRRAGSLERP